MSHPEVEGPLGRYFATVQAFRSQLSYDPWTQSSGDGGDGGETCFRLLSDLHDARRPATLAAGWKLGLSPLELGRVPLLAAIARGQEGVSRLRAAYARKNNSSRFPR